MADDRPFADDKPLADERPFAEDRPLIDERPFADESANSVLSVSTFPAVVSLQPAKRAEPARTSGTESFRSISGRGRWAMMSNDIAVTGPTIFL